MKPSLANLTFFKSSKRDRLSNNLQLERRSLLEIFLIFYNTRTIDNLIEFDHLKTIKETCNNRDWEIFNKKKN